MAEQKEKIIKLLQEKASEGKISCTMARQIAAALQVHPRVVGDLCNELKIKIKACELGCF
ncbi:hypothetical protein [Desulforamulus hydrothermalis]|uniref:Uncharacterized protein n=1 Tax=Desulforamulus hydrothermalis Lam5 = DSM 18033 TaxID=1121428 RepID=K8E960_9FIRM|nr:hypothetical protein [Desulforamulus hydrothermalis]CCO08073.1 conserved hypothetical protein [Desulforamulus hydrothermalis Lam5 = DSM 18033]SHG82660.1 hypothetical protein SAMN02745177_00477 [Desulforamulus hydrothermalis Lam5 = DSM 18033]